MDGIEGAIYFDDYVCVDDNLSVTGMLTDDDIANTGVNITPCEEDDESDEETDMSRITYSRA